MSGNTREIRPWPKPEKTKKKKRKDVNLSDWRAGVIQLYGGRCRSCGHRGPADLSHLEAHHLVFRSHCKDQYVTDVRNGILLCNFMGNNCHHKVHEAKLKVQRRWLPSAVLECLGEQGLRWEDGVPYGPSSRYFATEEITV